MLPVYGTSIMWLQTVRSYERVYYHDEWLPHMRLTRAERTFNVIPMLLYLPHSTYIIIIQALALALIVQIMLTIYSIYNTASAPRWTLPSP